MNITLKLALGCIAFSQCISVNAMSSAPEQPEPLMLQPKIQLIGSQSPSWPLRQRMRDYQVPAVSIAVIKNGRIAWAESYGIADTSTGRSVNTDTLFQAASVSKAVTATAAARLSDLGKLQLDAPVNSQLKQWQIPEGSIPGADQVTPRQLLTHSGGINVGGFIGYTEGDELPTTVQILNGEAPATSNAVKLVAEPGTGHRYSGGGYTIVQQLIAETTNQSFTAAMQHYLFDPAGMTHSTFEAPLPERLRSNAARAHAGLAAQPMPGGGNVYPESAAAGLWTTAEDLATLLLDLVESREGQSGALLQRNTVMDMTTPQVGMQALGFYLSEETDGMTFGHAGTNYGFRARMFAYVDGSGGAVVLANADRGDYLIDEILTGLASEYEWAYQSIETRPAQKVSDSLAQELVGKYGFTWPGIGDFTIEISLRDNQPWLDYATFFPTMKVHQSPEGQLFVVNGTAFEPEYDASGELMALRFSNGTRAQRQVAQ